MEKYFTYYHNFLKFRVNPFLFFCFFLELFFVSDRIFAQEGQGNKAVIEQDGKVTNVAISYFNDNRYITAANIAQQIIKGAKYDRESMSLSTPDFKIQFLPGSFYYYLDNLQETKLVQLYLPTIVINPSKTGNKNKTNSSNLTGDLLFVPFVSFMKSLDSAGLFDVSYEENTKGGFIKMTSKKTDINYIVDFPVFTFPKLNFAIQDLNNFAEQVQSSVNSPEQQIDEDYWDSEKLGNYNNLNQEVNFDIKNNQVANFISDIASKVYNSIKILDKTPSSLTGRNLNSGNTGGSAKSSLMSIMPRYKGVIKQRQSYKDPFPSLTLSMANDNVKLPVASAKLNNKVNTKKGDRTAKVPQSNESVENTNKYNDFSPKTESVGPNNSNNSKSGFYIPSDLKKPSIDD